MMESRSGKERDLAGHWKDILFCSERNQEPLVAFTRRVTLSDLPFNRTVLTAPLRTLKGTNVINSIRER